MRFAVLDLDLATRQWACHTVITREDARDAPDDEQTLAHVRPAMSFQLHRPGGPGPFFAVLPDTR